MRYAMTTVSWAIPLLLLATLLTQSACRNASHARPEVATSNPAQLAVASTSAPASQPVGSSSVKVYIKLVVGKKYGVLAQLAGRRDSTENQTSYDIDNKWWDNPLVVYADAPLPDPDVTGRADNPAILGEGASANVTVVVSLVPHADVAVHTTPQCDGIKGTITVNITTMADYYDGGWTNLVRMDGQKLTFRFDTCDPHKDLEPIGHEIRTVPAFALERYTRHHEKWEPKSNWPAKPASGDFRTAIYGKDARLEFTAYRYREPPVSAASK